MDRTARLTLRTMPFAAVIATCLLTLAASGSANAQTADLPLPTPPSSSGVSATLEACVTSVTQAERSATFSGEMTAIAGTAKMSMRIDVEERTGEEAEFHPITWPGLGVWRSADPKVKVYKYVRQVSNLFSPASYRALIRFRWLSSSGRVIKRAERVTTRCLQPAAPSEAPAPGEDGEVPAVPPSSTSTPIA
jgi:hypothetical protein